MQVIPVQATGNQVLNVQLNGQAVTLNIYQKISGLYMDVVCASMIDGGLYGVLCQNLNLIVRNLYLGFLGDFSWLDNQGTNDPNQTGLGVRYSLLYYDPDDLPAGIG